MEVTLDKCNVNVDVQSKVNFSCSIQILGKFTLIQFLPNGQNCPTFPSPAPRAATGRLWTFHRKQAFNWRSHSELNWLCLVPYERPICSPNTAFTSHSSLKPTLLCSSSLRPLTFPHSRCSCKQERFLKSIIENTSPRGLLLWSRLKGPVL